MSASQLLRILQTRPVDADDEIRAFSMDGLDECETSMNRSPRCTNPFLTIEEDDNNINFWNNPELETSIFSNEFTNNHEDEKIRNSTRACNVPSQLFEKSNRFYIDEHSIECDVPELMVCYQESDFRVKDICIDEGTTPHEETLSTGKDNHVYEEDDDSDDDDGEMIEASFDNDFLKHEWLRSPARRDCYMETEIKSSLGSKTAQITTAIYGLDRPKHTYEEKLNSSINLQDDVPALQQDWSLTSLEFPEPSKNYANEVDQQPFQDSIEEISKRAIVESEAEKLGRKDQMTNIILSRSEIEETQESVTFHFDTRKQAAGSDPYRPMNPKSVYELPLETETGVNHQNVVSCNVPLANHEMRQIGESSFSMAGVISELISCSRPMPYAGGISTGSDSSAASTRSFAFPKLETESISSPVRMGKGERKRLQKQKGWRQGVICCKF